MAAPSQPEERGLGRPSAQGNVSPRTDAAVTEPRRREVMVLVLGALITRGERLARAAGAVDLLVVVVAATVQVSVHAGMTSRNCERRRRLDVDGCTARRERVTGTEPDAGAAQVPGVAGPGANLAGLTSVRRALPARLSSWRRIAVRMKAVRLALKPSSTSRSICPRSASPTLMVTFRSCPPLPRRFPENVPALSHGPAAAAPRAARPSGGHAPKRRSGAPVSRGPASIVRGGV